MKDIVLNCSCFAPEHMLVARFADESWGEQAVFLSIHLTKLSFWKRLKYLFGFYSHGAFEEVVLTEDNLVELQLIVSYLKGVQNDQ